MAMPSDFQKLQKQMRGSALRPADPGYDEARRIYNAMIDRRPAVIARCAGTADVAAAVRFAREHGFPVSIRGGGHNVAGNAVCDDGVMIDCSQMKSLEVDAKNRIAKAQPGLTLGEFDQETTAQGLFTTMGVVSKTGIAGLTLGGGLGWLMGKFGLACDNLTGAEVVTAEGNVVRASEQENTDLLWGLRGGGGNFGVVTEFQYRLYPVEPMIGGMLLYPLERAQDVLRFYREVTANCPDELVVFAGLLAGPDGTPLCGLLPGYCGDAASGEKAVTPIRKFGSPIADLVAPVPYVKHQSMLDAGYPFGLQHYWKAAFMRTLPDEAIETVIEYFKRRPSPGSQVLFEHWHGAACRVPTDATAFGLREAQYNFSAMAIWPDRKDTEVNKSWIRDFWKEMSPHLASAVYVNYLGQEEASRVREAYGPNYERLVALKNKYDPTNFFRFNQNIQPTTGKAKAQG